METRKMYYADYGRKVKDIKKSIFFQHHSFNRHSSNQIASRIIALFIIQGLLSCPK